ncbi:hypothetical protein [uncultured Imperialibacter sp.]|uniref:hypothetical protein n=1 Tax=uncultured Imperialibacter sp. TaxID=1672639 RepID=UPI0030DBA5A7|tara:strand:+ start:212125 stop:212346 length:222 start_codon:yes stop_codon:yes gene_type:complete
MEDEVSDGSLILIKPLYDKKEVAILLERSRSTLNRELKRLGLFKKDRKMSVGDVSTLLTDLNIPNRINLSSKR